MALKNTQYEAIIREYNRKQLDNRREQEQRIQLAHERLPELTEIDREIASLSVQGARALINGESASLDELKLEIAAYGRRREILLKEGGFPADFLEMHYNCPDCRDTGYIENQKCHCFKQAEINLLYTQSNLSSILETENFGTFSYDYYPENLRDPATGRSALENIRRIVEESLCFIQNFDKEGGNLLFYGATGVGKTFLTHCIAKELLESTHSVIYFTAFDLFELLSQAVFRHGQSEEELHQMHSSIFDCDLLIIDDLGTEVTNSFVSSQLFLCINERLMNNRSTIISTNLSLESLRDLYSERVFSRISSNFRLRRIIGEDIRLLKKLGSIKP